MFQKCILLKILNSKSIIECEMCIINYNTPGCCFDPSSKFKDCLRASVLHFKRALNRPSAVLESVVSYLVFIKPV